MKTDFKDNTIRIWEKLNEIQDEFKYIDLLYNYFKTSIIVGYVLPLIVIVYMLVFSAFKNVQGHQGIMENFWVQFLTGTEGAILYVFLAFNSLARLFMYVWSR